MFASTPRWAASTLSSALIALRQSPMAGGCTGVTAFVPETRMPSGPRPMRRGFLRHKSDTVDLLESGFAGFYQPHGGFPERNRAGGARSYFELSSGSARHDQLPQFVVQHQQLADRLAALEAGAPAFRTSLALAGNAEGSDQSLRQDAVQRGDQVVAVDAHVLETAEDVDGVVRVHRRVDEVAGERRLHGDLG